MCSLARFSLLQVKLKTFSTQELQKLEDSEKHIICSNKINPYSSFRRQRQHIHDGRLRSIESGMTAVARALCFATGGPQPSGQSAGFNWCLRVLICVRPINAEWPLLTQILKASVNTRTACFLRGIMFAHVGRQSRVAPSGIWPNFSKNPIFSKKLRKPAIFSKQLRKSAIF